MTSKSVIRKERKVLSSSGVSARTRLYDMLEDERMRRLSLGTLLCLALILATVLLVLASISVGTFRKAYFHSWVSLV